MKKQIHVCSSDELLDITNLEIMIKCQDCCHYLLKVLGENISAFSFLELVSAVLCRGLPWWLTVKNLPAVQETWVQSPGQEDPLEKGMATHSSILAWLIPWTEEPGGLQSMGLQRDRHD